MERTKARLVVRGVHREADAVSIKIRARSVGSAQNRGNALTSHFLAFEAQICTVVPNQI